MCKRSSINWHARADARVTSWGKMRWSVILTNEHTHAKCSTGALTNWKAEGPGRSRAGKRIGVGWGGRTGNGVAPHERLRAPPHEDPAASRRFHRDRDHRA